MSKQPLVRLVANFLRRPYSFVVGERPTDVLKRMIEIKQIRGPEDWKNVRNEILALSGPRGHITRTNIDAMTLGICTSQGKYDLGLSYLDFLQQEQITPNLATLGKLLKLLYTKNCNRQVLKEDEAHILKLYEDIRKSYPVLDSLTLDNVVQALSITKRWKDCIELLDEIKVSTSPSNASYSAIVAAAFANNEDDLAWKLLSEMLDYHRTPNEAVYYCYFNRIDKITKKSKGSIEKMFNFMQNNHQKLTNDAATELREKFQQIGLEMKYTSVTKKGICNTCQNKLQKFDLSPDEFEELKEKVVSNVIVGRDVFNKSSPAELQKFQDFVANIEHHDVIVDGLNVAYSAGLKQPSHVYASMVASVVSYFVAQNKKVLVMGRTHMNRWPKKNWQYVLDNSNVFLAQDLSHDDPYLLYCALHSGRNTAIVTKDLMRGHKFLLRDFHLRCLFNRWLTQRQYQLLRVTAEGKSLFKFPSPYSDVAQKCGNYWHVPCENETKEEDVNKWLCIKF